MARKAKEILLARGYTEEDLKGMETLLKDTKFCSAIESEASEADTHKAKADELQEVVDSDTEWYQKTCVPEMDKMAEKVADAAAAQAAAEARLKTMQEVGLKRIASQDGGDPAPVPDLADNTVVPKVLKADDRYVTKESFGEAYTKVGDVIMDAQDIAEDHKELFGKRIPGGMSQLRADYQGAISRERYQGSIRDFWEKKYKVDDRKSEMSTEQAAEHEKKIREDERTKTLSELGNPMTRSPVLSSNPFTKRVGDDGKTVDNKPWDRNDAERSGTRVSKFTGKALQAVQ